ncbi:MAG: hypothetical protein KDN18_22090 [Verrucomicrobiae bacterium]|nr:hypothetical protein [Verrucomicrobiae bacterium]
MMFAFARVPVFACLGFLAGVFCTVSAVGQTAQDYEAMQIEGWTVRVQDSLSDHPRRAQGLALLQSKLAKIRKTLPGRAVRKLRQVTIWVSENSERGAAYHPSVEWLESNGRVPEMARSVEIQNFDDFIDWSGIQPWMVLHELAHAWHHRFLPGGYNYPVIRSAYKTAVKRGRYKRVLYYDGTKRKAYALTNEMEFFAEITEAYFGRNDFQPFNRRQLKGFDGDAYRMVERAWGVKGR